jgi:hypothetical protein
MGILTTNINIIIIVIIWIARACSYKIKPVTSIIRLRLNQ